jgi:hypothetical protein
MSSTSVGDAAEQEMLRLVAEVSRMRSGGAWVIRCVPDPVARAELAELLRADRVVVLLPPLGVLMARCRERPMADQTRRGVMRWMDRYAPWSGDELIRAH